MHDEADTALRSMINTVVTTTLQDPDVVLRSMINTVVPFMRLQTAPYSSGNACRFSARERSLVQTHPDPIVNEKQFIDTLKCHPRMFSKFTQLFETLERNLRHEFDRSKRGGDDDDDAGWDLYKDIPHTEQAMVANWLVLGSKGLMPNPKIATDIYARLIINIENPLCRCVYVRRLLDIIPKRLWLPLPTPRLQKLFPGGGWEIVKLGIDAGDIGVQVKEWDEYLLEQTTEERITTSQLVKKVKVRRYLTNFWKVPNAIRMSWLQRVLYLAKSCRNEVAMFHCGWIQLSCAGEAAITSSHKYICPFAGVESDITIGITQGWSLMFEAYMKSNRVISRQAWWHTLTTCVDWPGVCRFMKNIGEFTNLQAMLIDVVEVYTKNRRFKLRAWLCAFIDSGHFTSYGFNGFDGSLSPQCWVAMPIHTIDWLRLDGHYHLRRGAEEIGSIPCRLVYGGCLANFYHDQLETHLTGVKMLNDLINTPKMEEPVIRHARTYLFSAHRKKGKGHDCVRANTFIGDWFFYTDVCTYICPDCLSRFGTAEYLQSEIERFTNQPCPNQRFIASLKSLLESCKK